MTFSLVARCPRSGQFAVAVTSSSPAVAARCAYARAGIGALLGGGGLQGAFGDCAE